VVMLGEAARPALEVALRDDDLVVRREAAIVLRLLDLQARPDSKSRPRSPHTAAAGLALAREIGAIGAARAASLLRGIRRRGSVAEPSSAALPRVLILTPIKDAADSLEVYFRGLSRLTYPHDHLSIGLLVNDSADESLEHSRLRLDLLRREFRRIGLWKQDFGYRLPSGVLRWPPDVQVQRRSVLAMSRNHLLFRALHDKDWVLWLDVNIVDYPPDLIERLLATGKEIVQPHCVVESGGQTFDLNAWRDYGRLHLGDLREEGDLVELDAVGGTVLLVKADLHREGLVFPTFLYGLHNGRVRQGARPFLSGTVDGEIETEGLGMLARDMGYTCWGMPNLEVFHRRS
jgi:hypothetical protein